MNDEWNKMGDTNVKEVRNLVASILPTIIENKGKVIINLASGVVRNYFPGRTELIDANADSKE